MLNGKNFRICKPMAPAGRVRCVTQHHHARHVVAHHCREFAVRTLACDLVAALGHEGQIHVAVLRAV